ncbi:MAG: hypothetical protein FWE58_00565 [Methanobrevibacter sp.]|nr:hypothetical protein [Methanobrevibacter sp.]
MNIKKILIIVLFLLILASTTIGASYAASNEKINLSFAKNTAIFDKKIVSIDEIMIYDKKNDFKYAYKVNIKKANQNKYNIKSVKCKYSVYNDTTDKYDTIVKTYNGKNKTSLNIKPIKDYKSVSMTINYQTKSEIKKESLKFAFYNGKITKVKYDSKGLGKRSNIIVKEKGYYYTKGQGIPIITYIKFNIKTTNKKYKIKTVKLIYRNISDKISKTTTFNGKGKTTFTKVIKGEFIAVDTSLTEFKITYY